MAIKQARKTRLKTLISRNRPRVFSKQMGHLLQTVIDPLELSISLVDENHLILLANQATNSLFGRSQGSPVGKYCCAYFHGLDGPIELCPLDRALKTGKDEQSEHFDPSKKIWIASRIFDISHKSKNGKRIFLHTLEDITEKKAAEQKTIDSLTQLRQMTGGVIQLVQQIVEKRDPYTAGHQARVSDLARAIAQQLNLPEDQVDAIRFAGVIHDIGKIAVPAEILSKPGTLTSSEMSLIREHSRAGREILSTVKFSWPIADIVFQHHERMDGSGYPQGLKENAIMIEAKILAVADVVESMASYRPYRAALGIDKALQEITENRGTLYDQKVVDACLTLFREKGFEFRTEAAGVQTAPIA